MIEKILSSAGALIVLALGSMHLYYTFFSNKFSPRDPSTETAMKSTTPLLTRRTTMWNAWVGFNGSHSLGAIFFGAFNLMVLWSDSHLSPWPLFTINIITLGTYLWLAQRYWFRIPRTGILAALLLFLLGRVLTVVGL